MKMPEMIIFDYGRTLFTSRIIMLLMEIKQFIHI